jgi:hypothetical protein
METVEKTKNGGLVEEIDIPTGLVSYLEKKTRRTTYAAIKGRYSVTDIVGCQRRNFYNVIQVEEEELLDDSTIENMWSSVRGDLLHKLSYAYKLQSFSMALHYLPVVQVQVKVTSENGLSKMTCLRE